jgi:DNA-binding response OmpR family regulator
LKCVDNLGDATDQLQSTEYKLLLLDVVLPDGDGFQFCGGLRKNEKFADMPIILLTGLTGVADRVKGFDLGADDYVVKPLEPQEFVARVKAKLNRRHMGKAVTSLVHSHFLVDLQTLRAYSINPADGSKLALGLTPIEFKLLVHFINHEGKVVSREDLVGAAWGSAVHVSNHTVDTHVSSLRKKLKNCRCDLKAVIKQGYCFQSNPVFEKKAA